MDFTGFMFLVSFVIALRIMGFKFFRHTTDENKELWGSINKFSDEDEDEGDEGDEGDEDAKKCYIEEMLDEIQKTNK